LDAGWITALWPSTVKFSAAKSGEAISARISNERRRQFGIGFGSVA
jgi:hypothetical protein